MINNVIDLDDLDLSALDLEEIEVLTASDTLGTGADGASSVVHFCLAAPSCSCQGTQPT